VETVSWKVGLCGGEGGWRIKETPSPSLLMATVWPSVLVLTSLGSGTLLSYLISPCAREPELCES
jgi:hypothetical protein